MDSNYPSISKKASEDAFGPMNSPQRSYVDCFLILGCDATVLLRPKQSIQDSTEDCHLPLTHKSACRQDKIENDILCAALVNV
jgi:hypothetical protein